MRPWAANPDCLSGHAMKLSRMVSASRPVDHTCKKLCCIVDHKLHSLYSMLSQLLY